jgi:hypothetical protein
MVLRLMKMATMDVFGSTILGVDFQSCKNNLNLPPVANSFEFLGAEFQLRAESPFDLAAHFYGLLRRRIENTPTIAISFGTM